MRNDFGESKRRGLPQPLPKGKGFVAALMHRTWGAFVGDKKSKSQKVKKSKRQRVKETKSQRDKETKRLRDKESKRQRDKKIKRKRGKDKNQENPLKSMAAAPLL